MNIGKHTPSQHVEDCDLLQFTQQSIVIDYLLPPHENLQP